MKVVFVELIATTYSRRDAILLSLLFRCHSSWPWCTVDHSAVRWKTWTTSFVNWISRREVPRLRAAEISFSSRHARTWGFVNGKQWEACTFFLLFFMHTPGSHQFDIVYTSKYFKLIQLWSSLFFFYYFTVPGEYPSDDASLRRGKLLPYQVLVSFWSCHHI